jgi:hypothetical protein
METKRNAWVETKQEAKALFRFSAECDVKNSRQDTYIGKRKTARFHQKWVSFPSFADNEIVASTQSEPPSFNGAFSDLGDSTFGAFDLVSDIGSAG